MKLSVTMSQLYLLAKEGEIHIECEGTGFSGTLKVETIEENDNEEPGDEGGSYFDCPQQKGIRRIYLTDAEIDKLVKEDRIQLIPLSKYDSDKAWRYDQDGGDRMILELEDDADFAYRNGEYDNEVDMYGD